MVLLEEEHYGLRFNDILKRIRNFSKAPNQFTGKDR